MLQHTIELESTIWAKRTIAYAMNKIHTLECKKSSNEGLFDNLNSI